MAAKQTTLASFFAKPAAPAAAPPVPPSSATVPPAPLPATAMPAAPPPAANSKGRAKYGCAPGKPACSFGRDCYRKNPRHFEDEDHPADHPLIAAAGTEPQPAPAVTGTKRPAAWTANEFCDNASDAALADFDLEGVVAAAVSAGATPPKHLPPLPSPSSAASQGVSTSSGCGSEGPPHTKAAVAAAGWPAYSDGDDRGVWLARLQQTFLTHFADDIFDVHIAVANASAELTAAGVTLLAPFRLLSAQSSAAAWTPLSDRAAYDPPEFQPLVRIDDGEVLTLGYWRDDPTDEPPTLVLSRPNGAKAGPGATLTPLDECHLLRALFAKLSKRATTASLHAAPSRRLAERLEAAAHSAGVPAARGGSGAVAARKKKSIAPTSSKMGIVVPYDKKTELGYRALDPCGNELRKLLDKLDKASGTARTPLQAELDDVVNWYAQPHTSLRPRRRTRHTRHTRRASRRAAPTP